MNRPPAPPLMGVPQMATRLGVSQQHVYRMVRLNQIPFTRIGRLVKFDEAEITEWLASRRVPVARP